MLLQLSGSQLGFVLFETFDKQLGPHQDTGLCFWPISMAPTACDALVIVCLRRTSLCLLCVQGNGFDCT
jgi:hypothetical protein